MENRVKVGIRIRPLSSREIEEGANSILKPEGDSKVVVNIPARINRYSYDWVFDSNASQSSVYEKIGAPLVDYLFRGFNATVFAYGQTGSGKTHTMGGGNSKEGIMFNIIDSIFERANVLKSQLEGGYDASITMSYLEIYKEECFDLLVEKTREKLDLRENSQGNTFVDGLSQWPISSADDAQNLLLRAANSRSTSATAMNSQSSRSHSLCSLSLRLTPVNSSNQAIILAKLNLVDLAGSERAKKTLASGDIFNEGISINRGLLALGNVVAALATKSQLALDANDKLESNRPVAHVHVPYRESKLTRILKDSLGGNGMTVLLACVSPSDSNLDESLNTLKFGTRALSVINKAQINREEIAKSRNGDDNLVLRQQVIDLKSQLHMLQLKFDLMSAQQLSCRVTNNSKESISREVSGVIEESSSSGGSMVSCNSVTLSAGILSLASSLRSILRQNFEEDIELDEKELACISQQITDMQKQFNCQINDDGDSLELDLGMPPILKLIENILSLEDAIKQTLEPLNSDVSSSSSSSSSSLSIGSGTSFSASLVEASSEIVDVSDAAALSEEYLNREANKRETEIAEMFQLSQSFEDSIVKLREDITVLERQKKELLQQQSKNSKETKTSGSFVNNRDEKLKKDLQEMSQKLESKLQQLKSKEQECLKMSQQREKANSELQKLKLQLQNVNNHNGVLVRKLKTEGNNRELERKQLRLQEAQCHRREMIAQYNLAKMEKQLLHKEKVWKEQLASQQREGMQLKATIQKQHNAQQQRDQQAENRLKRMKADHKMEVSCSLQDDNQDKDQILPLNSHRIRFSNDANFVGEIIDDQSILPLNSHRVEFLEEWIDHELSRQQKLHRLRKELKETIKSRSSLAKTIGTSTSVRSNSENNTNHEETLGPNSDSMKPTQLQELNSHIVNLQGDIANTEFSSDKRKFGGIVNMKEAKSLISLLFTRLASSFSENSITQTPTSKRHIHSSSKRKLDSCKESVANADDISGKKAKINPTVDTKDITTAINVKKPPIPVMKTLTNHRKILPTTLSIQQNVVKPSQFSSKQSSSSASVASNITQSRLPLHVPKFQGASNKSTGALPMSQSTAKFAKQVSGKVNVPTSKAKTAIAAAASSESRVPGLNKIANQMNQLQELLLIAGAPPVQGNNNLNNDNNSSSSSNMAIELPHNESDYESESELDYDDEYNSQDEYSESSQDDLDENFYPEEDERNSSDDDDESEYSSKRRRRLYQSKRQQAKKQRLSSSSAESRTTTSSQSIVTSSSEMQDNSIHNSHQLVDEESQSCSSDAESGDPGNSDLDNDDDDDDDSDVDSAKAKRRKTNRKKKDSAAAASTGPMRRKQLRFQENISPEIIKSILEAIVIKPLAKHTVKELKGLLQSCGATLSGVKEELIHRLETIVSQQPQQQPQQQENILIVDVNSADIEAL